MCDAFRAARCTTRRERQRGRIARRGVTLTSQSGTSPCGACSKLAQESITTAELEKERAKALAAEMMQVEIRAELEAAQSGGSIGGGKASGSAW